MTVTPMHQHSHVFESSLGTPEITGRLTHFKVTPMAIPPTRLLRVI